MPATNTQEQEETIDDGQVYRIGDEVTVGKLVWRVNSATDRGGVLKARGKPDLRATAGRFIMVTCSVENRSGGTLKALKIPYLRTGRRARIVQIPGAVQRVAGLRAFPDGKPLAPWGVVHFGMVFDVPKDAENLRLVVRPAKGNLTARSKLVSISVR